jgi:hypothetical protein
MSEPKADLTTRERLVVWLILWLIEILQPWEYSHQQTEFINEIKQLAGK